MLQRMEKTLCFAVVALASVSLLYSRPAACGEPKRAAMHHLNTTRNLTHHQQVLFSQCSGIYDSYCIHGKCSLIENMKTVSCTCACTCDPGFNGPRCEHKKLPSLIRPENVEEVFAISCGVIFLIIGMLVFGCCCYRKWSKKPAPPYRNQEDSV